MTAMSLRKSGPLVPQPPVLPMSVEEMSVLGWDELDVLLVTGDAYVDHPSFAAALLGRWLVSRGYRVGVVAQPRWQGEDSLADITRMGRPRLFAGVAAGAVDSMLARYTAFRKLRSDDAYTPGGRAGARPNRAVIVYANLARRAFPGLPLVIGGIEASLRRVSHYDFWTNSLRRSILLDSKADILIYGMGETAVELAALAATEAADSAGESGDARAAFVRLARRIPGVASVLSARETKEMFPEFEEEPREGGKIVRLPSHEDIEADPFLLVRATVAMERQVHQGTLSAAQKSGDRTVLIAPPAAPLDMKTMDALYALPYSRLPHPSYDAPIPAWEMIRTSITCHRGCGGGCAFCSLALHQTRRVASRSKASILAEAKRIAATQIRGKTPAWAGAVSDVGGPSANMWRASCARGQETCERASCLFPSVCPAFTADQALGAAMLREVAQVPGVRHVRVASGVRFDLALADADALSAYTQEFTGGQLKVAPEHISEDVLALMRKPSLTVFEAFLERFERLSAAAGKEQYVVPYLMSAYPGCTDGHMRELARWLKLRNWSPRQVQCFVPTPGTVATAMYYAEKDLQGRVLPVAKTDAARMRQHYILLGKESARGEKRGQRFAAENRGARNRRPDAAHGGGSPLASKGKGRKRRDDS